jgi:hypothetical protein
MRSLNVHVFSDPAGFFSNKTALYINSIQPDQNIYINTASVCKNQIAEVNYQDVKTYFNSNHPSLTRVIFHSYNHFNQRDIELIRSKYSTENITFIWIFWSHEYYQLPEFFLKLYRGFSKKFYLRKLLSFHVEQLLLFLKGKVAFPFYKGLVSFKKTFKYFDVFGAFLEGDFDTVIKENSSAEFLFSSYLSTSEFPEIADDLSINKADIMIGHSGSPILNHYEIVKKLYDIDVKNELYIPLAYGKRSYIKSLRAKIEETTPGMNIVYQTEFMTKNEYYKKINYVGYFILNSFCQQALGNIVFFLWTGTKVFVRKETSTYKTFKDKSFHIYSIDDDLNKEELVPLTLQQKQHNKDLMFSMINDDAVKNAWLRILNYNR